MADSEHVDPRCVPQTLTEPPPVGDEIVAPEYPAEDVQTWSILFQRQMELLPGRAGRAFLDGVDVLRLDQTAIPRLSALSQRLSDATGWRVARVPGLLHEKDFFTLLSQRIFPSTDYIRGREELDYTPAPDCFHDIFGHM
ncbi:MAG TPA: phenylalanine 4-monooxygenase, partial [Rhodothermales bacterium]